MLLFGGAVNIAIEGLIDVKDTGIILALDVLDKAKAIEIVKETAEYIDAVKVGYPLVLSTGIGVVSELKELGKPVITDFKVADVPHISSEICRIATNAGSDYVIVQGFLGEDVIKTCSEVANIFVVCEMSHPGALDFMAERAEDITRLAKLYAKGIVAPATRPQTIKKLRAIAGNLTIISPGVKAQGAEVGDAIKAGADFEIIGRAIYNSSDPRLEAEKIYRQLRSGEK